MSKLLENSSQHSFIRRRIVTCGEKWIYFNNRNKQRQWLNRRQVAKPVAARDRFSQKALLWVWWNFEGIIQFKLVPNGRTIDADLYCVQFGQIQAALTEKYLAFVYGIIPLPCLFTTLFTCNIS